MPLFWIVHEVEREPRVFIGEGGALVYARLEAARAGHGGTFVEAHALDAKTATKIPKSMVGRADGA